jgi:hypothetical protein
MGSECIALIVLPALVDVKTLETSGPFKRKKAAFGAERRKVVSVGLSRHGEYSPAC